MSGYLIETRRVETRIFPYIFRFAANNGVPYTSARSVKLRLWNSPDNFAPSYKCVLSQKYLVP